jgi:hypothetical protein
MEARALDLHAGVRRDLVVAAAGVVALSRLVEGPLAWIVAGLLLAATLLGALQILGEADPVGEASEGVPIEALLTPAVAAVACVGAIRLVPVGPALVPAVIGAAWLVDRTLATEIRIHGARHGPTAADRTTILVEALVVAFLAFAGVAALVPGGLAEPAGTRGISVPLGEGDLILLAAADAAVAGLLGYRASALRVTNLRDALWSAATYASAVAIAAAALRAMAIPRLVGPALLTLVFFLWDAFHGAPPARRRDPRWIWQTVLLAVLGIVVVAWNLLLR